MKEILISIQPQWVEKILNGEKTIEIRTTVPKEWKEYLNGKTSIKPEPSKWYAYCTKAKPTLQYFYNWGNYKPIGEHSTWADGSTINIGEYGNGKIVAEFTLNQVDILEYRHLGTSHINCYIPINKNADYEWEKHSCINYNEIVKYGKFAPIYALHIDDLKIYDVPKELSEFVLPNKKHCKTCFLYKDMCENVCAEIKNHLFRPPQSWCYVESL